MEDPGAPDWSRCRRVAAIHAHSASVKCVSGGRWPAGRPGESGRMRGDDSRTTVDGFATAGMDGAARVWTLDGTSSSGFRCVAAFGDHTAGVRAVAMPPPRGGRDRASSSSSSSSGIPRTAPEMLAATGSYDRTARLWHASRAAPPVPPRERTQRLRPVRVLRPRRPHAGHGRRRRADMRLGLRRRRRREPRPRGVSSPREQRRGSIRRRVVTPAVGGRPRRRAVHDGGRGRDPAGVLARVRRRSGLRGCLCRSRRRGDLLARCAAARNGDGAHRRRGAEEDVSGTRRIRIAAGHDGGVLSVHDAALTSGPRGTETLGRR